MTSIESNQPISTNKTCLGCSINFTPRRKDQVYCSKTCSNTHYNNHIRNDQNHRLEKQNFGLEILATFLGNNRESIVTVEQLLNAGFRFDLYSERIRHTPISETYDVLYGPYLLFLTQDFKIQINQQHE